MKFFDAHSHIHGQEFDGDREEAIERMRASGTATITVGTFLESSKRAVQLAENNSDIWATVGLHPTDTTEEFNEEEYRKLAGHPKVVGIGECGLDYFWQKEGHERAKQRENFRKQIELAISSGKPLMIHSRPSRGSMDAYDDVLGLISEFKGIHPALIGNVHFFVGDTDIARKFIDMGFTLSFTGVVTFARDYDETIKYIPLDAVLTETDCPYVAPVPYRGKRNEPAFVTAVAEGLAKIRGITIEALNEAVLSNVGRVFGIKTDALL